MVIHAERIFRHLAMTPWHVRRTFPPPALSAIEAAIRESEKGHLGEIRFAVEGALSVKALLQGQTARARAIETFSHLGVWDTEFNNGILIYLLLADRDVEIVADRAIHRFVGEAEWERVCRHMEGYFQRGEFGRGVVAGISEVSRYLVRHFPAVTENPDELQDQPVIL